jgi:hypothetical protein
MAQVVDEGVRAELAAAVGVHGAPGDRRGSAAASDSAGQGGNGESGGHPVVHRVAHDPPGAGVLDRAEVELALLGGVLGDVGQPQLVGAGCGELAAHEVVVHRRARPAPLTAFAGMHRGQARHRAEPPDPAFRHLAPGRVELVGDEAVDELGVVVMDVDRGVHQVGVVEITGADGVGEPGVVGLAGNPDTRHVTATGTPVPASWPTRGNIILGRTGPPGTSRPRPCAGPRSPAPAAGCAGTTYAAPPTPTRSRRAGCRPRHRRRAANRAGRTRCGGVGTAAGTANRRSTIARRLSTSAGRCGTSGVRAGRVRSRTTARRLGASLSSALVSRFY